MFPLSSLMKSFIQKGSLTVIDVDDKRHVFSGTPGLEVVMKLHDKKLYRTLVTNSELAAGEAYMDGTMTFEEGSTLRDFLQLFSHNRLSLAAHPAQKAIRAFNMKFRKKQQSNRKGQAQENVSHHYDLGNEFYKLFLDKNMLYSCAYFREEDETLEDAQRNKLRLLASKLDLKPGSDKVEFRLQDYREVPEKFDRIVSVGMFEHVGVAHYDEFFKKLNDLMPDDGLAVIHSIGHMSPPGMASSWLRKYIFPGAYSPALSEVFEVIEQNHLWCTDLEMLRVHYATTLLHWVERFEMFRTGSQHVFHMQLSRNRDGAPIVRDYITDTQRELEKLEKKLKLEL